MGYKWLQWHIYQRQCSSENIYFKSQIVCLCGMEPSKSRVRIRIKKYNETDDKLSQTHLKDKSREHTTYVCCFPCKIIG